MLQFILLTLAISHVIWAQSIASDPSFDCTNPNFQVIYTACSAGDYTNCCAVGTDCCAGGCCDLLSWCVGVGTSQETCCDINDVTLCGTGPDMPQPSVVCTGSNGLSSYKCPPGATCDMRNDSCYGGDDDDEPTQTERETPTRTPAPSTEADEPTTTTDSPETVVVTQTVGDDSSTTTKFHVRTTRTTDDDSATTSAERSVSVSILTVSATPTTTTGSSSAGLNSVGRRLMILAIVVSVYL